MGILYKTFHSFRTGLCLAFLFLSSAAMAQDESVFYKVHNINVDVSAENALKAREKAFEQAQIKAFEELAGRLLDQAVFSNFKAPPAQTISIMIQDYEVSEEKLSPKRYSGTYIFRFRRSAVEKFLAVEPAPVIADNAPYQTQAPEPETFVPAQRGDVNAAPPQTAYSTSEDAPDSYGAQTYTDNFSSGAVPMVYPVRVVFSSLSEWTNYQRALARVYGLNDIQLKALSPREAYIEMFFSGDMKKLQTALAQADLTLSRASITVKTAAAGSAAPVYELRFGGVSAGTQKGITGGSKSWYYQSRF